VNRRRSNALSGPPSFGQVLRGARLGWHWVPQWQAFMKIYAPSHGKALIDIRPNGTITAERGRATATEHVVWWEDADFIAAMVEHIPALRSVTRVKKPLVFDVDVPA